MTTNPPELYAVLRYDSDAICVDQSAARELASELSAEDAENWHVFRLVPLAIEPAEPAERELVDDGQLFLDQLRRVRRPRQGPAMTAVQVGTCARCGQEMLLTADDCWHPYNVERPCPPEPPSRDRSAWGAWYAAGNRTGRPGREHWRPA